MPSPLIATTHLRRRRPPDRGHRPGQHTTQYAYDTENNLLSITDANAHTTQFAYNSRGWVTQTTFPSTLAE